MEEIKRELVKRGHVYKWHEGQEDERFVLAVIGSHRGAEKAISALMFGTSNVGRDVVMVGNNLLGNAKYLHCGMVTYINRQDMSDLPLFKVSDKTMALVDRQLCIQLGVTNEDTLAELRFYKQKCNELIKQYIGIDFEL